MRAHVAALNAPAAVLWALLGGLTGSAAAAAEERLPGRSPAPGSAYGEAGSEATAPRFDFDIPAQSLAAALNRYASLTQRAALFRSELVSGRTSAAVRGRHTPEAALALLLEGTGLVAETAETGPADAFVLKAVEVPVPSLQAALSDAGHYPGLIQASVWLALCGNSGTAPGDYRALLRFWVDAGGQLSGLQLLGSTGNSRRDAAVLRTLRRIRLETSPPPGMPQPVTMLIVPNVPGGIVHCEGEAP